MGERRASGRNSLQLRLVLLVLTVLLGACALLFAAQWIQNRQVNTLVAGRARSLGLSEEEVFAALEPAFGITLMGMAALLFLALAATWLGTSILLVRRIEALQVLAQRLRGGDLGARAVVRAGRDQLDELTRSLDGLASELDEANRRRDELQRRLEHAVELREEFLSIAAHELRTPMTSIRLQVELLGRSLQHAPDHPLSEGLRQRSRVLLRQIDRMTRLVDTLMEVSRINGGRFVLELAPLDLCELVRSVAERFVDEAVRASARVSFELPPSARTLGDRLRLEQVMTNLLANALKHAGGTTIELSVRESGMWWALTVRDDGCGIPPDKLDRIFDRFERGVTGDVHGGLGLGLYISRQIVEAHGGMLSVQNLPDGGAEFSALVPRREEPTAVPIILSRPASA